MKHITKINFAKRTRRHARIRSKVIGTPERPRLSIFKSNKYLSAQIIDDSEGKTLLAMTTKTLKGKTQLEKASLLGKEIAAKAIEKKISSIVFDRGGFIYTGKVKAVADAAREGGLIF